MAQDEWPEAGAGNRWGSADTWVTIREVGPRDGLQVEAPLSVEARVEMILGLIEAGLECIEVAAFVSPTKVPSMADAPAVLAALPPDAGATYFVLVPNLRGAQMAVDAGAGALTVTVSASESYSAANVGRGRDEAAAEVDRILTLVDGSMPVDVVVSCAFGYGVTDPPDLAWIADQAGRWAGVGPCSMTLADTTGEAGPPAIEAAVGRFGPDFGLHLHETRRTGLVNAYAALVAGVRRLDTSVAGLGGSPFAEGAAGNLATEDLVHLLDQLGLGSGVRLDRLLDSSRWISSLLGRAPTSLALSGPAGGLRRA